jgi:hypothetical protein
MTRHVIAKSPDLRRFVGVCMTCRHWQIDIRPGAISDLGGGRDALMAIAQAHADHLDQCPGAGGRVNFNGQWVTAPLMESGNEATGTLEFNPLPRWWVSK